ncbi:MAG: protein TolR, partial [Nevskia sp.]|nr:protein TolR [Nevskia sp.]
VNASGVRKKRRLNAEINVVPYIDVMLVLLVIFMVTAPLLTQGVDVELPQTSSNPLTNEDQPGTLSVDARGRYFLDVGKGADKPVSDDELAQLVHAVVDQKPDRMILVRADSHVSYDKVVKGMSILQGAGAKKIGFVTDAPSAGKTDKRNP